MARERHAPKIFLRVNRFGVPYVAVLFLSAFLCLAYMTLSDNASTVFSWFQVFVLFFKDGTKVHHFSSGPVVVRYPGTL